MENRGRGNSPEITELLRAWNNGDAQALERLTPVIYHELRGIARKHMRKENFARSLQPTDLVHEAYLRLAEAAGIEWKDRGHFFAIAARMMRRILVDASRARRAAKRGAGFRITLNANLAAAPERDPELLRLDEAIEALAKFDARKSQVVEMRVFGGLSVEETARVLEISPQSVLRDWKLGKAWLSRELERS